MILAAGLLGAAAALLAAPPSTARRLRGILSSPSTDQRHVGVTSHRSAVFFMTGLVAWWLVGGVLGALLGAAVALGGPRCAARLDDGDDDGAELAVRLPLALDLLGACLAGGGLLQASVSSVAGALPGPCGERFAKVASALALGSPPEEAFRALGDDRGPGGSAARALARAAEGGTPVAAVVMRVAEESRRAATVAARKRAKRAGVLAVGPLGACFLPAFMLLGVVPAVVGLATPLLHAL